MKVTLDNFSEVFTPDKSEQVSKYVPYENHLVVYSCPKSKLRHMISCVKVLTSPKVVELYATSSPFPILVIPTSKFKFDVELYAHIPTKHVAHKSKR